jgi:hypothetical protein
MPSRIGLVANFPFEPLSLLTGRFNGDSFVDDIGHQQYEASKYIYLPNSALTVAGCGNRKCGIYQIDSWRRWRRTEQPSAKGHHRDGGAPTCTTYRRQTSTVT